MTQSLSLYGLLKSNLDQRNAQSDARQARLPGAHRLRRHTESDHQLDLHRLAQERADNGGQSSRLGVDAGADLCADGADLPDRSDLFSKCDLVRTRAADIR